MTVDKEAYTRGLLAYYELATDGYLPRRMRMLTLQRGSLSDYCQPKPEILGADGC